MSARTYCILSSLVFSVVAAGHLVRAARGVPLLLGNFAVPIWPSWVAAAVGAGLAVWGFRLASSSTSPG
jgi:hypothetical protein